MSRVPNTLEEADILNEPIIGTLKYPLVGCKPGFNCKRALVPSIK